MKKRQLFGGRGGWWAVLVLAAGLGGEAKAASPWWGATWVTQRGPAVAEMARTREEVRGKTWAELVQRGREEREFFSVARPETEWMAWRLAHGYRQSGDVEAAERAVALMVGLAERPVPTPAGKIHDEGKFIPFPVVIAYGLVKEAPVWGDGEGGAGGNRERVERWLGEYAAAFTRLMERPGQLTNYTPFGLRHAASLGLVTGDEALLARCGEWAWELAFGREFWHADHIWQEGTVSYARQVSGNLRGLLPMLRAAGGGRDEARWDDLAARLTEIDRAQAIFSMPSGRPIPVHDTHWTIPPEATPRAPRGLAYPDFGHWATAGTDMELHLSVPPLTGGGRYGGGHYHDSRLAVQLWAHGQEVLPDAGYPFRPANHRYFHASATAHNVGLTDPEAVYPRGPYGVWGGHWARSALLGYDDGGVSGGRVSYLAAASPGPAEYGEGRAERALLQVKTGVWSGYVVDVFWLQGGRVHESYLRQTEDEAVVQAVSAELRRAGRTLAAVLGETGTGDRGWKGLLREPQRVETAEGFAVSWKGEASGVELRMFLAPQEGSSTWLSQMPRVRPTEQDVTRRDDYPGWHLTRRREVAGPEVTLWAAVYEPVAPEEEGRVRQVKWTRAEDGTGVKVEVDLGTRKDTWLLGWPERLVTLDGVKLEGRAAGFVEGPEGGWSWAAAGSRMSGGGRAEMAGPESVTARVKAVSEAGVEVEGGWARPDSGWVNLRFADGSGRAMRVGEAERTEAGNTRLAGEAEPGLRVDAEGMQRTFFPQHAVPGVVTIEALGGAWRED